MRDLICIYTGQGAAGDFKQIAIFTGQFSTCSPVVMFNTKDQRGGLYHLPGKSGNARHLKAHEWPNLKKLIHMVEPNQIVLFPAGSYHNRQGFLDNDVSIMMNTRVDVTDEDFEAAGGAPRRAKEIAFDRTYKGDQIALSKRFAQTKAVQAMSYNIEQRGRSYTGIQVTAGADGQLLIEPDIKSLGGTTYDLAKGKPPPAKLCTIISPERFDYSLWYTASNKL
jgi:hypothetical protein